MKIQIKSLAPLLQVELPSSLGINIPRYINHSTVHLLIHIFSWKVLALFLCLTLIFQILLNLLSAM